MKTLEERFEEKYIPEPMSGCWLWDTSWHPGGYGKFWFDGRYVSAHRMAYMLYVGEIPEGLVVMHTCDVACCVNPDHLRVGTQHDNVSDMVEKGRHLAGHRKRSRERKQWAHIDAAREMALE